jgi:hypothetical protein
MVWYVAFIALLNLVVGFAMGVCMSPFRGPNRSTPVSSAAGSTSYDEFDENDEYYSDEHYEESAYEAAVAE